MMALIISIALASIAIDSPPITCAVVAKQIVVKFNDPFFFHSAITKFAIVQGAMLRGGEWLYVIDDQGSPLRFSTYRPGMRRLIVDTRRQLAVRYSDGKARIVRAFAKPGPYTLVFADNLGIDYGDMISWKCRVHVR